MFLGGVCDFRIQIMGYSVESNQGRNVVRDGSFMVILESEMLARDIAAAVRGMSILYLTRWLEKKPATNQTKQGQPMAGE